MKIIVDDLTDYMTLNLINVHLNGTLENTRIESVHALNAHQLKDTAIVFYSAWENEDIMGCGALKELSGKHGEIKSMRTAESHLRKGVAKSILTYIIDEARSRGYDKLGLETGTAETFKPAHQLYEKYGFTYCEPFGDYKKDLNSVFIVLIL